MATLAYNLSPKLEEYLEKIESLRKQILLTSIPPKTELRLKWEAVLNRVFWSLSLTDNTLTKQEMTNLLSQLGIKRLGPAQKQVINYKKALDYINENWLVSSLQINFPSVKKLFEICFKGIPTQNLGAINSVKKEIDYFLEYLQTGKENPILQAGIAQIVMIELSPSTDGNGSLARLIPYLFLYKHGYDMRGLLVIDEYLRRDVVALKAAITSVRNNKNLTLWLEYFSYGIAVQLTKALEDIQKETDNQIEAQKKEIVVSEIKKDAPAIFLFSPNLLYATTPKIKNITLKSVSAPNERFLYINDWYIETDKVWKIFIKN